MTKAPPLIKSVANDDDDAAALVIFSMNNNSALIHEVWCDLTALFVAVLFNRRSLVIKLLVAGANALVLLGATQISPLQLSGMTFISFFVDVPNVLNSRIGVFGHVPPPLPLCSG